MPHRSSYFPDVSPSVFLRVFDFFKGNYSIMSALYESRMHGNVYKIACPVCTSSEIENVWKIPMTTIDPPAVLFGGYFNQVPTLKSPFVVYGFDYCRECQSVFLNPDSPRQNQIDYYKRSTHYVQKMENKDEWRGYVERYEMIKRFLPERAETFIDAACGLGQLALLARDDKSMKWRRLAALELSSAYVKHLTDNGIEAYEFDIDHDSIDTHFEENSIDFVAFFEAFEHVSAPLSALKKLIWTLRPGGRIFFSAQRYGNDCSLPIRPGEPIYVGEKFIEEMEDRLDCDSVEVIRIGSRFFVVLEKRTPGAAKSTIKHGEKYIRLNNFRQEINHCWVVDLEQQMPASVFRVMDSMCDNEYSPKRSDLRVFEEQKNGELLEMRPAHSSHAKIREVGLGNFSHWKRQLYFSTSDNTDPILNSRKYFVSISES